MIDPEKRAKDLLRSAVCQCLLKALPTKIGRLKLGQVVKNRLDQQLAQSFPNTGIKIALYPLGSPAKHICVQVWGEPIAYEDRIDFLCDPAFWVQDMRRGLQQSDPIDVTEREDLEETLRAQLTELDRIAGEARAAAMGLILDLPIPASATVRNKPEVWARASPMLRAEFPLLFAKFEGCEP